MKRRYPKDRGATESPRRMMCRYIIWCMTLSMLFSVLLPPIAHGKTEEAEPVVTDEKYCSAILAADEEGFDILCDARRLPSFRRPNRNARRRSKFEIEKERREKIETTNREIDEVYAVYAAQISRKNAKAIGTVYARYSTRFQDSIADQVRAILEHAQRLNIFVPREFIYFDLAVRGYKAIRAGLSQMESTLCARKAKVLLMFSTSRLFRKTYRTLQFVDTMHRDIGARCIFVKSGVDTDEKTRWESILYVQSMVDQFVVSMYVANIHAAHEGLLSKKHVFGTLSYGYAGEPVPGEFTRRKLPRCRIIIDPVAAAIVRLIFQWYVGVDSEGGLADRFTIQEIVQKLNDDPSIPLPPKVTSERWTRMAVRKVLTNTRYRALWQYGVTESVYVPSGDYVRQNMRSEPLKEAVLEEFRIVSDELWYAAQEQLVADNKGGGRPAGGGRAKNWEPVLLNGLVHCSVHQEQQLHVSGAYGNCMQCPVCRDFPAANRPLFTRLLRKPATQIICNHIAEIIRADAELITLANDRCMAEVQRAQQPDPTQLQRLATEITQLERAIAFTRRTVGPTDEEQADAARSIREMSEELTGLRAAHERLKAAAARTPRIPTEVELRTIVDGLGDKLAAAGSSQDLELEAVAKRLLAAVIQGPILIEQQGERARKRGWLRARFRLDLASYVAQVGCGQEMEQGQTGVDVVVDLIEPEVDDEQLGDVWRLYEQDLMNREIAHALKMPKSKVERLLRISAQRRGIVLPDGRARRGRILAEREGNAEYKRIADKFGEYTDLLYLEIAELHDCVIETVEKAAALYYSRRGEVPPDGRRRRKTLNHKVMPQPKKENDA